MWTRFAAIPWLNPRVFAPIDTRERDPVPLDHHRVLRLLIGVAQLWRIDRCVVLYERAQ